MSTLYFRARNASRAMLRNEAPKRIFLSSRENVQNERTGAHIALMQKRGGCIDVSLSLSLRCYTFSSSVRDRARLMDSQVFHPRRRVSPTITRRLHATRSLIDEVLQTTTHSSNVYAPSLATGYIISRGFSLSFFFQPGSARSGCRDFAQSNRAKLCAISEESYAVVNSVVNFFIIYVREMLSFSKVYMYIRHTRRIGEVEICQDN